VKFTELVHRIPQSAAYSGRDKPTSGR